MTAGGKEPQKEPQRETKTQTQTGAERVGGAPPSTGMVSLGWEGPGGH